MAELYNVKTASMNQAATTRLKVSRRVAIFALHNVLFVVSHQFCAGFSHV